MKREIVETAREYREGGWSPTNVAKKLMRKFNISLEVAEEAEWLARRPQSEWPAPVQKSEDRATQRQINYIRDLGVMIDKETVANLTKKTASQIITAVKSGDGVGTFGLTMRGGSN